VAVVKNSVAITYIIFKYRRMRERKQEDREGIRETGIEEKKRGTKRRRRGWTADRYREGWRKTEGVFLVSIEQLRRLRISISKLQAVCDYSI